MAGCFDRAHLPKSDPPTNRGGADLPAFGGLGDVEETFVSHAISERH